MTPLQCCRANCSYTFSSVCSDNYPHKSLQCSAPYLETLHMHTKVWLIAIGYEAASIFW